MTFNAEHYWEDRLSRKFHLSGTGHIAFGRYYNKFLYKAKLKAINKVLQAHNISIHNKTICDIGPGTGFFIDFYHQKGGKSIVGIDLTTISIDYLSKKYPQYQFTKGDISSPSLLEKIRLNFDIINAFDILYHIMDDDDFTAAIVNISRLTNDNGYIFITDALDSKTENLTGHVKCRNKQIYMSTLNENNIHLIATYPLYYLLNRPIFGNTEIIHLRKIGMRLDNLFAPIFYFLDRFLLSSQRNNLSLLVGQKLEK
jgi:2-polyprenyl-3-methyl-5-hydroxy-6-metoxy-1,4-benzoquinol methylase